MRRIYWYSCLVSAHELIYVCDIYVAFEGHICLRHIHGSTVVHKKELYLEDGLEIHWWHWGILCSAYSLFRSTWRQSFKLLQISLERWSWKGCASVTLGKTALHVHCRAIIRMILAHKRWSWKGPSSVTPGKTLHICCWGLQENRASSQYDWFFRRLYEKGHSDTGNAGGSRLSRIIWEHEISPAY